MHGTTDSGTSSRRTSRRARGDIQKARGWTDLTYGVTSIGDRVFANNKNLAKAKIPESVTSIGEGVFETGWYWVGSGEPVISVTIDCEKGSVAEKYAREHGISILSDKDEEQQQDDDYYYDPDEYDYGEQSGGHDDTSVDDGKTSLSNVDKTIKSLKSDNDINGSKFLPLQFCSSSANSKNIKLKWKAVKGASK